MNIAIDIRSTLKNRTGIGNYTFGLVKALAGIDRENTYFLYSYIRPFDLKRVLWPLPGRNFTHKVDRLSFRPEKTLKDADALHTSSYDIPASRSYGLFTTVHDLVPLIFPQGYSDDYLSGLEDGLKRVFTDSRAIAADSENTKKDIEKMFPGIARRIDVIYPGKDVSFSQLDKGTALRALKTRYGINEKFLLYSGGMDPRKNVTRLIEAFGKLKKKDRIPHKFVVAGKTNKGARDVFDSINRLGLEREVIFTGYIPADDLNCFYSAADCFVYPSLYEGFGFPILEAFSSGVPVVASSTSSCGELAEGAAITVDPSDADGLAGAIREVISDKELASSLIKRGLQRSGDFSWEISARKMLSLFQGN